MRIAFATECRGNFALLPVSGTDFAGEDFFDGLTAFFAAIGVMLL